tara:strand:- start:1810 stop:2109 length:300 start_codon:yes stop_codon:yes gene_type:complete
MEEIEVNFLPYTKPTYTEKIVIASEKTIVDKINLQKYDINQKKFLIEEKYRFIDLDKLYKIKGKYTVAELKEIAKKIDVPTNKNKLETVKLIKKKIGVE